MLVLENVALSYGHKPVLRDVSFRLSAGEIGCLLGASGCGKTTALRLVAGFETLQAGSIAIAGHCVAGSDVHVVPEARQVGLVFQDYALFPHLDVARNIAFGLGHLPDNERRRRTAEMLALVGLTTEASRYPHELSGGQQQRVALARALAPRPRLLLLDEPFSNLDIELREKLSVEVRDILKHEGMTALLVTHDQYEAFAMADAIGVMDNGEILQWDSPYNLYHRPRSRRVAEFVGEGVLLPGKVCADCRIDTALGLLDGVLVTECDGVSCKRLPAGAPVNVLLRPDDIVHDDHGPLSARVERKAFRGAEFLYTLRLPQGEQILVLVPSHHDHGLGEAIGLRLDVDHVVAFRV